MFIIGDIKTKGSRKLNMPRIRLTRSDCVPQELAAYCPSPLRMPILISVVGSEVGPWS